MPETTINQSLSPLVEGSNGSNPAELILFPIVGIGASAGGLEAMEQFLKNVPANSGMAYVMVQHLDPTHKGMLPELLQRITPMKVFQAKDNMPVHPNCVYVIPPNKSMSIVQGRLQLFKPQKSRGLSLPIDFFLSSLAQDRKEWSIGLILSGMGSDGSEGLRAIKENNGIVMVQEPETAKFDSMPQSALKTVLADMVGPPEVLAEKLITLIKQYPLFDSISSDESKDYSEMKNIISLLRDYTGNDFSMYKKTTLSRRIERRMGVHNISEVADYVSFLQENPNEGDMLFRELMIGVTSFFRDDAVWKKVREEILPAYLANVTQNRNLRAWVPGCSSGEEAYTLAMIFMDTLKNFPSQNLSLQIFATDLDNDAIETARKGLYPLNIETHVPSRYLEQFFRRTEHGYRINNEIREMVVFAQHNLIMHPPFINIDIISCRNLLIYLEAELQKKILNLFYYCLNTDGIMVLGGSETLGAISSHFESMDNKLKIFKRAAHATAPDVKNFPSSFSNKLSIGNEKPVADNNVPNIQTLTDQLVLQHFSPPGVLINVDGDILYISGRTGKYLEPSAGKANLNIFSMLREGLRHEFHIAFHKVLSSKGSLVLHNLKVGDKETAQTLNISIHYINKPEPLIGTCMVIFTDVPDVIQFKPRRKASTNALTNAREKELENELQYTREEMQTSQEEMQTSQEELRSANEELQSTNEELQSANEELMSSKEEMQSLNEELQTLNAELMAKVEDFVRVDNDMKNLLNSTDIATLFIDKDLNIRRYTYQATKIFKLIKSDIGRPFTDQVSELIYPHMADDAKEVLRTLVFIEKQIPGKDDRWFLIRIMPYRTFDDRIDGLVITFIDITQLKQMEQKYKETLGMQNWLFNTSKDIVIMLSAEGKIKEFNPEAEKFFGVKNANIIRQDFLKKFIPQPMDKEALIALNNLLKLSQDGILNTEVIAAKGKKVTIEFSVKILFNDVNVAATLIISASAAKTN
jgi:two-component system, chemotaxis family, CheB/CheR fusion protein